MPPVATHLGILAVGLMGLASGACVSHIGGDESGDGAAHVPARRLSRNEYNNTVRDLFAFRDR